MDDPSSWISTFTATYPVDPDTLSYFSEIPWTAAYLQPHLYTPVTTYSRVLKPTGEDAFFALTINTPTTIPRCLTLLRRNVKTPPQLSSAHNHTNPEIIWLLSFALPGVNGHPGTVHGGLLTAILDEVMGAVVILYQKNRPEPMAPVYTARLETQYRAPVLIPCEVVVTAWLTKTEGRKWWVRGQVVNEEGIVTTEGEGLWIEKRKVRL